MERGDHEAARLDDLADEVAEMLSAQLATSPRRARWPSLRDHGFQARRHGIGTTSAKSGGASARRSAGAAFAWLVGGVH